MKLIFRVVKSEGNSITIPFGIKKCKLVAEGGTIVLENVGPIGSIYINNTIDTEFPIINGKSPCVFKVNSWGSTGSALNIFVTELGGIPDPNYFSNKPTVIEEIISADSTEGEVNKDAI